MHCVHVRDCLENQLWHIFALGLEKDDDDAENAMQCDVSFSGGAMENPSLRLTKICRVKDWAALPLLAA